ncbi:uncharacterized protein Z520_10882 [Fonsecaea multimorphosa CBS 102226]|uniref:Uncharacterized protein n=1 Tax=Fonsecaea multimorphosa CBS 102226 TaxID=1442371 RepID=A0A0D2JJT7_9EURO|nr:uncharacterized protein Z520_10882 [Fonsecaea multimorphosa CBS 102226]KIX93462.1 hypothetical protein Z520_10882 [Fonsecaea multimorphosa CBS 102226]
MTDPTASALNELSSFISKTLADVRGIHLEIPVPFQTGEGILPESSPGHFGIVLDRFIAALVTQSKTREAEGLRRAKDQVLLPKDQGGLELELWKPLTTVARESILFWVEAWLKSLSAAENSRQLRPPLSARQFDMARRGMTLTEKILAHHAFDPIPLDGLRKGDVVRVSIDWIVASESSYFVSAFPFPFTFQLAKSGETKTLATHASSNVNEEAKS